MKVWRREPKNRAERRAAEQAQSEPPKHLFGDGFDRLMALGANHPSVLKQVKPQLQQDIERLINYGNDTIVASPHIPIIAVLFESHCKCGRIHTSFGFLAERRTYEDGSYSLHRAIDQNAKPEGYLWQKEEVSYCIQCIANGLPYVGN